MQTALRGWLRWLKSHSLSLVAILLIFLSVFFLYRLNSTPHGLSPEEANYRTSTSSVEKIISHPVNEPHKAIAWTLSSSGIKNRAWQRNISVFFAVFFTVAFYFVSKAWFGKTIGILSTLIFSVTPLFLVSARQASPVILLFSPIVIMAAYSWLIRTKKYCSQAWIALMLAAAIFFYVPGVLWWLLACAVITRKKLITALSEVPQWVVGLGIVLFLVFMVPAGWAIFKDWTNVKDLAAIPAQFAPPLEMLKNISWMLAALVIKTPHSDPLLIGRLPVLDIVEVALLVFGLYAMWTAAKDKALALIASILMAVVIAGLNNNIHYLALGLPAAAIFMAAGLRYLYIEWRSIFPRNPIARMLAIGLMIVVVGVQLVYGLSYSLVAWPHTTATKTVYVVK